MGGSEKKLGGVIETPIQHWKIALLTNEFGASKNKNRPGDYDYSNYDITYTFEIFSTCFTRKTKINLIHSFIILTIF